VDTSPRTGTNSYYGNWWGGNLRGVKDYPINLGKTPENNLFIRRMITVLLVYEQGLVQRYLLPQMMHRPAILYEQCWRDNWAYIMENGTSPLLIGEWGGKTEGTESLLELNKKYMRCMRDYIVANKYKLHHTFWCINIDSSDTDGLLTRGEGTPFEGGRDLKWNDNKYDNYLLPTLWENTKENCNRSGS
jgi:aryl-phospho-beta-D-glucosidase BglC (GH1 family)